jgi:alpha-tubulin suppressor-like RCC1 family protein
MIFPTKIENLKLSWLLIAYLLLFIPTTQAQTSKIKLVEGVQINQPVYEDGNIDFSVKVKNTTLNEDLQYDALCISVRLPNNLPKDWHDLHCTGSIILNAQQVKSFNETRSFKDYPTGTYRLVAKAKFAGEWYDISPGKYNNVSFEVISPKIEVSLSPSSYTFPQQIVDFSSSYKYFTLRNTGNKTISGQAILVGSNTNDFYLGGSKNFTIAPNQSTTLKVKFNPKSSGYKSAKLRVSGTGFSEEVSFSGSAIIQNTVETPPQETSPQDQPDETKTACIGYNYEQELKTYYANLKKPNVSIEVPNTSITEGSIKLEAKASIDSRGTAFFYWCADQGGFSTKGSSANYSSVAYYPPQKETTVNISVLVGDSLGFINTDGVKLEIINASTVDEKSDIPTPTIISHSFEENDVLGDPTAISIRWGNQSKGFYDLERSTDQVNYTRVYCSTDQLSIGTTDRTPKPNNTYWYRLRISTSNLASCSSNANWSSFSKPYQVDFLLEESNIPTPSIISHSFEENDVLGDPTAISIRWGNQSKGFYDLERSTDQVNYTRVFCSTDRFGIGTTDKTPKPNNTYWYRLRISTSNLASCSSSANWSSFSKPYKVDFLLEESNIPTPSIISHSFEENDVLGDPTAISIRWGNQSKGFYDLERSTDQVNYMRVFCSTDQFGIGTTDRTPKPNNTYWYRLRISTSNLASCSSSANWSSFSKPYKVGFLLEESNTGDDNSNTGSLPIVNLVSPSNNKTFYGRNLKILPEGTIEHSSYIREIYLVFSDDKGNKHEDRTFYRGNTSDEPNSYNLASAVGNLYMPGDVDEKTVSVSLKIVDHHRKEYVKNLLSYHWCAKDPCPSRQDTDGDGIPDINDPDDDNDKIVDAEDAFPLNSDEYLDTDNDGIGNNADNDDDNDQLPDNYENQYAFLNPLDPLDAFADQDGDGISNLDEYKQGTNPAIADNQLFSISGTVKGPHGNPMSNVIVTLKSSHGDITYTTKIEGTYEFKDLPVGNYQVSASGDNLDVAIHRSFNNSEDDVMPIVNHALGKVPFDSLQCAAADVTQDHEINIVDIMSIINVILKKEDEFPSGNWQFLINSHFTCASLDKIETVLRFDNLTSNQTQQDFIGIRMGDVDHSWFNADHDDDNDQLPDDYENQYAFLNPLDPSDAFADQDGDGYTNLAEYQAGTNPNDAQSLPGVNPDDHGNQSALTEILTAGSAHTCILKSDGTVTCWGSGMQGRTTPPNDTFTQISAGRSHTCGLKTDQSIACWGQNLDGQINAPEGSFIQVSSGGDQTCALRKDGKAVCWGEQYGQTPSNTFTHLATGSVHACGLRNDQTITCWGQNGIGQLNAPSGKFTQMSAGGLFTCALRTDANLVCWGSSSFDKLTPPDEIFSSFEAGQNYVCALLNNGEATCWGDDRYGQATPPTGTFTQLSAGDIHTCGIKTDGSIACWGYKSSGAATPPEGSIVVTPGPDSLDTDGDGINDDVDIDDDDDDGVADTEDAFPLDASEAVDTDSDGVGNNADTDDDGDGVADINDAFPLNTNESIDTDGDGTGNNADTDDDGDGVTDANDAFPLDANESVDTDGDGTGNNADKDDDGDNVADTEDAFPLNANESIDTDSDGVGNNADTDDDGDGVADANDAFPLDANESVDTDGDGVGNNADTDDDGDGLPDDYEKQYAFLNPLDPSDAAADEDQDGTSNLEEYQQGTAPNVRDDIQVRLVVDPNPSPVQVEQDFDVTFRIIQEGQLIDGSQFQLIFDEEKLQVNSVTNSDVLDFPLVNEIDNTEGQVTFAVGSFFNTPPTGAFDLVTINFTAKEAVESTELQFDSAQCQATYQGNLITQACEKVTLVVKDTLACKVELQGRPSAPHASWETVLRLSGATPAEVTTDNTGYCEFDALPDGEHTICVKNAHTLQNKVNVSLPLADNNQVIDFGLLLEGDISDDNVVELADFSLMFSSKGKCQGEVGFNVNADLNVDGCNDVNDAKLLQANFMKIGQDCQGLKRGFRGNSNLRKRTVREGQTNDTTIHTSPIPVGTEAGSTFEFDVEVHTEAGVDAAAVYFNFPPDQIQVNYLTVGDRFDFVLQNEFDNTEGYINFAAGVWFNELPTGMITLVTVNATALKTGAERSFSFNTEFPRATKATFGGKAVVDTSQKDDEGDEDNTGAVEMVFAMIPQFFTQANMAVTINLPVADVITATDGSNGTVQVKRNNHIIYTPNPDFSGTDSFTYTIGGSDRIHTIFVIVDPNDMDSVCYAVADNDGYEGSADVLVTMDKFTSQINLVGETGTQHIEAVAFNLGATKLYAADAGQLGQLDLTSGNFTPTAQPFGQGPGALGIIVFDDVDGLTFDALNGILYGSQRLREEQHDVLFKIDPSTGASIPNAFGAGIDYVVIEGPALAELLDIDDIALDNTSGVLYGATNTDGKGGQLVTIDTLTGAATAVGQFGIDNIEGLAFFNNGQLFGTTGTRQGPGNTDNRLYQIDKYTGITASLQAPFSEYQDYESVGCLTDDILVFMDGERLYVGRLESHFTFVDNAPVGISIVESQAPGIWTAVVVSKDEQGRLRQQNLYPIPVDAEVLRTFFEDKLGAESVILDEETILVEMDGQIYQGMLSYDRLVTDQTSESGEAQILSIADANGDGLDDYVIIYPNGQRQTLYFLGTQ